MRQGLVNCSGCAEVSSVLEVPDTLRESGALRRGPQPVLLKVTDHWRAGRADVVLCLKRFSVDAML